MSQVERFRISSQSYWIIFDRPLCWSVWREQRIVGVADAEIHLQECAQDGTINDRDAQIVLCRIS